MEPTNNNNNQLPLEDVESVEVEQGEAKTPETKNVTKNGYDDFDYLLGQDGFSLQNLEEEAEQNAPQKKNLKKRKQHSKSVKTIISVVAIFGVSILLASSILLFATEYLGINFGPAGECVVEIDEGMGTAKIASKLKSAGAINSSLMFRIYSKLAGNDGDYKYGVYTFSNELGYKDIARMLKTEGAKAQSVTVTIPEQASMEDIMKLLEDNGVCTKSDFRNAVRNGKYDFDFVEQIPVSEVAFRFEGYLFPDTYDFYCYDSAECAELAIRKMLKNLDDKLTDSLRNDIAKSGYTIHEVLTMASIVELEASSAPKQMPKVAAVFYNRLEGVNWNEPALLGSSPTADYKYGNGRYDTNKNEGLPPGPLCAPSINAIKASVYPAENFTATYFVTDSEMKFYYNNSMAAHKKTISSLKQQGKWLG